METDEEPQFELFRKLSGHDISPCCVCFNSKADQIATAGNKFVVLHDLKSGEEIGTLRGHSGGINDLDWSPCGRFIGSAGNDTNVLIHDAETNVLIHKMQGHCHKVFTARFHSCTSNLIITGGLDETVRLWDLRSGKCIKAMMPHSEPINSVDFSTDGQMFLTSSMDGLCRIFDFRRFDCLKTLAPGVKDLRSHEMVGGSIFSPNDAFVLSTLNNGKLCLVECETGRIAKEFEGHLNKEYCASPAFITDSKTQQVTCGVDNNIIKIWDIQSMNIKETLTLPENSVCPNVRSHKSKSGDHLLAVCCVQPSKPALPLHLFKRETFNADE
eukprot:TRINITY_DN544154_c0_g1_i1.p1 TRINITY_DN544154_c0_g1~~TRINITY_DN544154_c0_g1_i1.p1  ORF type:complete len:327 (+),score=62.48 TRINITY_DN544154_c0_g1_i1:203-1183(+)